MSAQRSPVLAPEFATRVLHDVSMAKHTSWHVGGPADLFFTPRDVMDLASFLRQLPPEVPLLWLGLGSNLLVRDGGIRGAVISTHGALGAWDPPNSSPAFPERWEARSR
jgi:UDP-N-acetylmuramate dehydrogenase